MEPQEDFVLEVLDLIRAKFKNHSCTKEQYDSISSVIAENLPLWASAEEIAEHFGKSRDAVHSIVKNKMLSKPRRNITLYNFKEFCRRIPSSWRKPR